MCSGKAHILSLGGRVQMREGEAGRGRIRLTVKKRTSDMTMASTTTGLKCVLQL